MDDVLWTAFAKLGWLGMSLAETHGGFGGATEFGILKPHDRSRLSVWAMRDEELRVEVRRVFEENFRVYGVREVSRQLRREGFDVARCAVSRLMRQWALKGRFAANR